MTTRKSCGRCQCAGLAHNLGFVSRNRCQLACEILVFNPTGAEWSLQSALLHIFGFCCWCEEITIPQRGLSLNLKKRNMSLLSTFSLFAVIQAESKGSRIIQKCKKKTAKSPVDPFFLQTHLVECGCSQVYGNSWDFPERRCLSRVNCDEQFPSFPTMLSCPRWDTLHVRGDSWDEAAASHAMIRMTDRWPLCLMGSYQAGADRHSVRSLVLKSLSMNTLLLAFFVFCRCWYSTIFDFLISCIPKFHMRSK